MKEEKDRVQKRTYRGLINVEFRWPSWAGQKSFLYLSPSQIYQPTETLFCYSSVMFNFVRVRSNPFTQQTRSWHCVKSCKAERFRRCLAGAHSPTTGREAEGSLWRGENEEKDTHVPTSLNEVTGISESALNFGRTACQKCLFLPRAATVTSKVRHVSS